GLACSRNRVLKECETRYVIFIDDDVIATREAVEGARTALSAGADVIGTRITADYQGRPQPWCLTAGQLHYLGAHSPAAPGSRLAAEGSGRGMEERAWRLPVPGYRVEPAPAEVRRGRHVVVVLLPAVRAAEEPFARPRPPRAPRAASRPAR